MPEPQVEPWVVNKILRDWRAEEHGCGSEVVIGNPRLIQDTLADGVGVAASVFTLRIPSTKPHGILALRVKVLAATLENASRSDEFRYQAPPGALGPQGGGRGRSRSPQRAAADDRSCARQLLCRRSRLRALAEVRDS